MHHSDKVKVEISEFSIPTKTKWRKTGYGRIKKKLKYSEGFNRSFNFYFSVNRKGVITFCGEDVNTKLKLDGLSARECFKRYDNGVYNKYQQWKGIETRHPNILKSLIIGKKGWGLWMKEWSDGIKKGLFTKQEILDEFTKVGIIIPNSFLTEFYNKIYTYDKE